MVQNSIWQKLKKPIIALAPMEDVTDTVFRQIIGSCGVPDLFFTEFVNCDGLFSKGREKVIHRLQFSKKERPIIAQIWGKNPDNFYKTAQLVAEMGFDGIDINMGCPQRKVVKHGVCAALINNQSLAQELIHATQEGSKSLPVSVKTRIGLREIITEEWIGFLLKQNLDVLIVHGRTAGEMSRVPCHWDEIGKAVNLKNKISPQTILIGNGDVRSLSEAFEKVNTYKVDGVMIGRGIFTNPWLFNKHVRLSEVTSKEKLELLLKHLNLFDQTWTNSKHFKIMKKFIKIYVADFPEAKDLRNDLMEETSLKALKSKTQKYITDHF